MTTAPNQRPTEKTKLSWDWNPNIQMDFKGARALEYIAHYLELIEGHLAIIAAQSSNSGKIEMAINSGLKGLEVAIAKAAQGRS